MGISRRRKKPDKHRLHDGEDSYDLEALGREASL